jgi:hypothetical protein
MVVQDVLDRLDAANAARITEQPQFLPDAPKA